MARREKREICKICGGDLDPVEPPLSTSWSYARAQIAAHAACLRTIVGKRCKKCRGPRGLAGIIPSKPDCFCKCHKGGECP